MWVAGLGRNVGCQAAVVNGRLVEDSGFQVPDLCLRQVAPMSVWLQQIESTRTIGSDSAGKGCCLSLVILWQRVDWLQR